MAILVIGFAAAVLMLIAELTPLYSVKSIEASCKDFTGATAQDLCETTGSEQHSNGLFLIAFLTLGMAVAAGPWHSRPAAIALVIVGVVVLGIALIGDVPDTDVPGFFKENFEEGKTVRESGLYLEMLGGVLAILAGVLRLSPLERPPPPEPRPRDRPPEQSERKPPERPQRERRKRPRPADA